MSENPPQTPIDGGNIRAWYRRPATILIAIMAVGLAVRLIGVTRESVWWDEYSSLVHLEPPAAWRDSPHFNRWNQQLFRETAPNLWAFWKQNRSMDPATMPLYYTLEYFWHKHISDRPAGLRLLSILIGMAVLPVIYLFGRDLFGANAGLIAALCVALSPIHRQFSQEIRMYGLMTLLALLSCYAFMHLLRHGGRRWWTLYAVTTLLLFWTHPFATLVPAVQGLYWLCFHAEQRRRFISWAALTGALFLPSAAYIATIRFWPVDSTGDWMKLPTLREFAGDLFADDCIGLTYQLRAGTGAWEWLLSPEAAAAVLDVKMTVGRWMAGLFIACAIGLCAYSLIRARRSRASAEEESWPWRWPFFLVLWWLLPPLILYVISIVWRPCIMPRYTVHSSLGLYLLIGGVISVLHWRAARRAAVVLLIALYGYQQMLVIGNPQHEDWLSAGRLIRAESTREDLILVHNSLWKRIFAFNTGPMANILHYSDSLDGLAELAAFYLDWRSKEHPPETSPPTVWAVIQTLWFESGPSLPFEQALAARGLDFRFWEFGGIQRVLVYAVRCGAPRKALPGLPAPPNIASELTGLSLEFWRLQQYEAAVAAARRALDFDPDFALAYSYMGMAYKEAGDEDAALEAFRKAVALDPDGYPWSSINLGMILTDMKRYDEAIAALQHALALLPDDSWAYTCLGRAHRLRGDAQAAVEALEKAIALDPHDPRPREELEAARQSAATVGRP